MLPELKASQPHHKTKSPITALTGDPNGKGAIPLSYRPSRGPNISALANAELPPIKKVIIHKGTKFSSFCLPTY